MVITFVLAGTCGDVNVFPRQAGNVLVVLIINAMLQTWGTGLVSVFITGRTPLYILSLFCLVFLFSRFYMAAFICGYI